MTKKDLLTKGAIAGAVIGALFVGTAIAKAPAKMPVLSSLKDATWTALMKDSPLPALAPIEGDPMKGAFMGYLKLPAGFESPPHAHSKDYWSVLIQGKMTHWATTGGSERDSKQLGVGDLTFMPAKVEHVSKCFPGSECIMVMMQKGKFDFLPSKTGTTPAAAPAPGATAAPPPAVPAPAAPKVKM